MPYVVSSEDAASDELERAYIDAVGWWCPEFKAWATNDPESFGRYVALARHVHGTSALDLRERALISVALNATATHLLEAGLRCAIDGAFDAGATVAEIREVLELTCGVGMHTMIEALPVVLDAMGKPDSDEATREARTAVRDEFERRRGYWSDFWEAVLAVDHGFLDRYTDLSAHPWESGTLEPKLREFVYIAIDASTTHLYGPGLEAHVANAIDHGATREELVAVIEQTSLQGYDTMAVGMPVLLERAAERGQLD